jgi:hypothetical protein
MNIGYCWSTSDESQVKLSPWDIIGLQNVYGPKYSGNIAGKRNLCLSAGNPNYSTYLTAYDCYGGVAGQSEKWMLAVQPSDSFHYRIKDPTWADSLYNTIDTHTYNDYQQLWQYVPNSTLPQAWQLNNVSFISYGGTCLDLYYNNVAVNSTVELTQCNGGGAQKWDVNANWTAPGKFSIALHENPNFCLGKNTANASPALVNCSSTDTSQQFSLLNGRIVQTSTGACLGTYPSSSVAPATVPGTITSLYYFACRGTTFPASSYSVGIMQQGQLWYTQGPIKSVGSNNSKCIHMNNTNGVEQVNSKIDILGCNDTDPTQVWDFHF